LQVTRLRRRSSRYFVFDVPGGDIFFNQQGHIHFKSVIMLVVIGVKNPTNTAFFCDVILVVGAVLLNLKGCAEVMKDSPSW